jgi:hypothetical protein
LRGGLVTDSGPFANGSACDLKFQHAGPLELLELGTRRRQFETVLPARYLGIRDRQHHERFLLEWNDVHLRILIGADHTGDGAPQRLVRVAAHLDTIGSGGAVE